MKTIPASTIVKFIAIILVLVASYFSHSFYRHFIYTGHGNFEAQAPLAEIASIADEQLNESQHLLTSGNFTNLEQAIVSCELIDVMLVKIKQGKPYYAYCQKNQAHFHKRSKALIMLLERLNTRNQLPQNIIFAVAIGDHFKMPSNLLDKYHGKLAPVLVYAINQNIKSNYEILFVDDYTYNYSTPYTLHNWLKLHEVITKEAQSIPWSAKKNQLIWRGRMNDKLSDALSPREQLVELSKQHSELINAKSDKVAHFKKLHQFLSMDPYLAPQKHLMYRFQIVMDGSTSTYPGFLWRLASGSLTFKQQSDNVQWFYSLTKSGEHYVEVNNDLSDLVEKLEYYQQHQDLAQAVSQNAARLIEEKLNPPQVEAYISYLLQSLAKREVAAGVLPLD